MGRGKHKNMIRRIFIFSLLIVFSGCLSKQPSPPTSTSQNGLPIYVTPVKTLSEIPIFIGEMTFNEYNNSGFSEQYVVAWSTNDLEVTTDGKVTGTILTSYEGPPVSNPKFQDVLFFQVQGRYVWPQYGDYLHQNFGDVMPIMAEQSDEYSAKFRIDGTFQTPPLVLDMDGGMPLTSLNLTLTWVRVFKGESGIDVQVFAGDANRYPEKPQLGFDSEPNFLTGRFGYYTRLPEEFIKSSSDYDYFTWLKNNLTW